MLYQKILSNFLEYDNDTLFYNDGGSKYTWRNSSVYGHYLIKRHLIEAKKQRKEIYITSAKSFETYTLILACYLIGLSYTPLDFRDKKVLHEILNALLAIAYADNVLHYKEEKMLIKISEIFKISSVDYNRIKGIYENKKSSSSADKLKRFYNLLGVSDTDSLDSIKKKYRSIIKEYHPDRIQGKGLPDEFINFANKKLVEFNEAYNEIKKQKQDKI